MVKPKFVVASRHSLLRLLIVTMGCPVAWAAEKPPAKTADRIVIEKSAHTMKLMSGGQALKTYKVALGDPRGTKQREGDRKAPEGEYVIDSKNDHSRFHRALHISYPNTADRERAKKQGVNPGGDIEIHGLPSTFAWAGPLHRLKDWTAGCIAVTNSEIDEIWRLAPVGTPVEIRP